MSNPIDLTHTGFINVDLIIKSNKDLKPLIDYLESKVMILSYDKRDDGYWYAILELNQDPKNANKGIDAFAEILFFLPRELWILYVGSQNTFDIGYVWRFPKETISVDILNFYIEKVKALYAGIKITVYPIVDSE